VNAFQRFKSRYTGLIPAEKNILLSSAPILLTPNRTLQARVRRELYRWTGIAPSYHARLREVGAALVHAHFAEGASGAVSIAESLQVPLLMHLRGGAEMQTDHELSRRAFEWPYLLWRRRLWKRATLFLCVSDFIRRKALAAGFPEQKLRVHYTGINFSQFSPEQNERDKNLVLYVGRLVPYKGADHLIRAMHRVKQSRPDAHLVVIGAGDFLAELKSLTASLNVTCTFLGEQPPAEVRNWLRKARVFCGPSLTQSDGTSEAFGNVFTEAQAVGVPVVSYHHGGIPETMLDGQTGLLATEGNIEQLASHILRYLRDDAFWARSSDLGIGWVRKHFDVFSQTAKLEDLYAQVLTESGANC
jgi:glycosyltransferase involved in cell wall biosynthesis